MFSPLKPLTCGLIAAGAVAVVAAFFLPLWQIQLWAPQYPEGLNMKIWHNRLGGEYEIINGLNHYIGMKEIKPDMFPEFKVIGPVMGVFIALGLIVAAWGKQLGLWLYTGLAYLMGAVALYDFYRWGYDYGHNLSEDAAIKVPGMAYQPPVLGYKNLLNFTAYSGPDQGGWVVVVFGLMLTLLLIWEWKGSKRSLSAAVLALLLTSSSACNVGPEPIRFGQDACAHCKMTITDQRFGAEIVTDKGRIFKFDDLNCAAEFIQSGKVDPNRLAFQVAVDYQRQGQLIPLSSAFLLRHEAVRSPMRSDIAVLSSANARNQLRAALGGGVDLNWQTVCNQYK